MYTHTNTRPPSLQPPRLTNAYMYTQPPTQFLTFIDYLLRSYTLFRVESAYEVRTKNKQRLAVFISHAYTYICMCIYAHMCE